MLPAGIVVLVLMVSLIVCVLWGLDVLKALRDTNVEQDKRIRALEIRTGMVERPPRHDKQA